MKSEQRLAGMRIGDDEAQHQREADQAADIAGRPAEAGQRAEPMVADERGHHGVGEHGGELGADGGDAERDQHERQRGRSGPVRRARARSSRRPAAPRRRRSTACAGRPASAMAPSTGAMAAAISSAMPVA